MTIFYYSITFLWFIINTVFGRIFENNYNWTKKIWKIHRSWWGLLIFGACPVQVWAGGQRFVIEQHIYSGKIKNSSIKHTINLPAVLCTKVYQVRGELNSHLLYILTKVWLLQIPKAGQNLLFQSFVCKKLKKYKKPCLIFFHFVLFKNMFLPMKTSFSGNKTLDQHLGANSKNTFLA